MKRIKINLGCGKIKYKDFINIDRNKSVKPDIIADLNHLPIKSNKIDYIYSEQVLEHIQNLEDLMKEFYRILKPNGIMKHIVPHFTSISAHIGNHIHTFSSRGFIFCDYKDNSNFQTNIKYKIKSRIVFNKWLRPFEFLANLHPFIWEQYIRFPNAESIIFEFEKTI
ncbi:MAG: class I SAM-dependent methyltransferase [Candidatus Aenigmatarchaeota archaeon]|nr:class I SAM-dependent methyltransferase [Candidatus Aenigmarchaeota archaeon]